MSLDQIDADIDVDLDLENAWNFVENFPANSRGYENCPRCDSVPECYAECNKDTMMEFDNINTWSQCKDTCVSLGGKYAFKFADASSGLDIDADVDIDLDNLNDPDIDADIDINNKPHPDRGCAMFRPNTGKCICVKGNVRSCKNIGSGMENCPNCGPMNNQGILGGAPECLVTCKWEFAEEFNDIFGWDECSATCNALGPDFRFKLNADIDALDDSDKGCAIYARYNNQESSGKCVCVAGKHNACVSVENVLTSGHSENAHSIPDDKDAWDPETGASSHDMLEGYGVGAISTLFILLVGIFIVYTCKWRQIAAKRAESVKYSKVINVDETTDDERVVIKK